MKRFFLMWGLVIALLLSGCGSSASRVETPTGEPVPTPTPNPNASFFVTFVDWDGRTIAIKTAKYGEAATPPPDPERENFIFVGWEGDFSCVTANMAVLAKYGPIPNSGDASGDGAVNAVDALVAMRYVLGVSTENLTPEQIAAADIDGDGKVDSTDIYYMLYYVALHGAGQKVSWDYVIS